MKNQNKASPAAGSCLGQAQSIFQTNTAMCATRADLINTGRQMGDGTAAG